MNLDENIWISNNNEVKNNTVFSSGRGDIALSGPVSVGNCFANNTYHVSSPPMLESMQGCGKLRYPWAADMSSTIGLLALFVQASLGDFELPSYKNQAIPPKQENMPKELEKRILPAHDVFESNKFLIEKAELPKVAKSEMERYQKESSIFTSGLRVHFPGTWKTWFFHLIGYLLPFTIFASWTGLAILDLVNRKGDVKATWVYWIIMLIPFLGAMFSLYSKESLIPRRITNSLVFGGIGFFISILLLAVYAITRVAVPAA
jgi:hypothetical protein